jgi:hypothetical protein
MFFIVLSLFILLPASLVYAEIDLDLSNYSLNAPDATLQYRYNLSPIVNENWSDSKSTACTTIASLAKVHWDTINSSKRYMSHTFNNGSCDIKRYWRDTASHQYADTVSASLDTRPIPACPVDQAEYIDWYVVGHRTAVSSACSNNCEYMHKDSPGMNSPPQAFYGNGSDNRTHLTIPQAFSTGKGCTVNPPVPEPECSPEEKAANGGKCLTPDSAGNKCPDSEKTANGGQCNTPDPAGNKCPDSEKTANGGQCNTPDPAGNKCPTGEKEGNDGKCQTADGDGNKCTDALKASLGGKCPVAGTGECTPEQKAANGGTCPVGSGGTCTANPINKKFCDLADWLTGGDDFKLPDQETDIPKREISRDELPQAQRINFGGGCPAAETFSAFGQTVTLSYSVACDLMILIKPFVILAGNLLALFIFINSIRN